MNVTIVGREQADRWISAAVGEAILPVQGETRKVLRLFHDRHIGIPPDFARDLAQGFSVRYPDFSNPVRLLVYRRLLDALDATRSMKQDPRQFDHIPRPQFYDICLLPLTAMVMEEMGETFLFSLERGLDEVDDEAYRAFARRFEAGFLAVCETDLTALGDQEHEKQREPQAWPLFWERVAHQLWGELQRARHGGGDFTERAFARVYYDDVLLRMVHGLAPKPSFVPEPGQDSFELTEEQNAHLAHPKQGGVVGIHTTARVEDIEDMLLSEMVLPPHLLADKLLNSSFFARHRPPPLDQKQQVLLLGASLDDGDDPVIALAKACWLDAIFRMAIVLAKNDLLQSEVRFGQWCRQMGVVTARMKVGDYRHLKVLDAASVSRLQMHRFFCDAGWLPGFLSLMPGLDSRQDGRMAASSFRQQKEPGLGDLLGTLFPEASGPGDDDLPDFAAALMVVIRRARVGAAPFITSGPHSTPPTVTMVINCPAAIRGGERYILEDGQKAALSIAIPGGASDPVGPEALNKLAGELVGAMLQFFWDEVNG
ncbi:hypothetical protein [uncultured Cohaesibacter sp.]|uniref:hypothetical protein n=1 Tax=uncultured Cohaesibacter sp. TaxID=1002546 RepID=UPI0029C75E57|nr:hypothetical protein [uncultured Cohaesibacter sp.]